MLCSCLEIKIVNIKCMVNHIQGKSYRRKMPKKLLGILSTEECIIMANMLNKCVYVHAFLCTYIF